jgi:plasmid stabilization system protein ParE
MSDSPELSRGYTPHPALEIDVNAIIDHYLEQGSPDAASRVITSVFAMIDSLVPIEVRHRGHRRHDLTDRPLLFVSVSPMRLRKNQCTLLPFYTANASRAYCANCSTTGIKQRRYFKLFPTSPEKLPSCTML